MSIITDGRLEKFKTNVEQKKVTVNSILKLCDAGYYEEPEERHRIDIPYTASSITIKTRRSVTEY